MPSAQYLLECCNSTIIKLNNAKYHLDQLLSTGAVIVYPSQPTGSATTGTFATSSATNVTSVTDYDVSRELDDFFMNLVSAYDMFAHVINRTYFSTPINDADVTFYSISDEMARRFPSETITAYLTSLKRESWHRNMKAFRKCTTHGKAIKFRIDIERGFMETSWMTKIVLPDNPFSNRPTYLQNREMRTFGIDIFKKSLNAIDHMYGIMEARIRSSDRIPI